MNICRIELKYCEIPFRFSYGHALATHRGVKAVLCIMYDNDGNYGVGESVPRAYVTGESVETVMADAEAILKKLFTGPMTPADACEQFTECVDTLPKPFPSCAVNCIDGALMTLRAVREKRPLYALLGDIHRKTLQYYGSIGIGSTMALLPKLLFYKLAGFRNFKVKVRDGDDIRRISMIKKVLGGGVTLFADANCAWEFEEAVVNARRLHEAGVWALEEPLKTPAGKVARSGRIDRESLLDAAHYKTYHALKNEIPIPLIADESLVSPGTMKMIVEHDAFSIANIRLSKCGGTLVCNRLYRSAVAAGMEVGLGAMVGESPFLAAIGSHFGAAHPGHRYIQGHSHRVLHRCRIGSGEPAMTRGGILHLPDTPGTGVAINRKVLQQVTISEKEIIP